MSMHKNYSLSLSTKLLENSPLLINTQHYSFFQIVIWHQWRQTPLIKVLFHPASYTCTADHSLSGVLAKLKVYTLHIQITQFSDCICVQTNLTVEVVCRVGEHQLRLAHQCSPCEKFAHTWTVKLNIMGIWEWGIYGLNGVGQLWQSKLLFR